MPARWTRKSNSVGAGQILRELQIKEPSELSIENIAWTRGADTSLVYMPGIQPAIIRVNATIPRNERRRFAIAHEPGHRELKHNPGAPAGCGEKQFVPWDESQNNSEVEADILAAEPLMPEAKCWVKLERTLPSMELIKQLADVFQTTITRRYLD